MPFVGDGAINDPQWGLPKSKSEKRKETKVSVIAKSKKLSQLRSSEDTYRIGGEILQGRVTVKLRVYRCLIESCTRQGHQRHIGGLKFFGLAIPLGRNHVGQRFRGNG